MGRSLLPLLSSIVLWPMLMTLPPPPPPPPPPLLLLLLLLLTLSSAPASPPPPPSWLACPCPPIFPERRPCRLRARCVAACRRAAASASRAAAMRACNVNK